MGAIQLGQLVKADFFVNFKTPTPIPIGGLRHGLGFVCPEPCFQALIRSHLHDSALLAELDTGWFRNLDLLPLENPPSD